MRAALLLCLFAVVGTAQTFTQRGFLESTGLFFTDTAPNDSSSAVGEALLRYEAFLNLGKHWRFSGGVDARWDTHLESDQIWRLSVWDRERQRPSFDLRRLSLSYTAGKLTIEAGKQFVRWGKTDVLNPTDRFAPRDYLNLVDNDFLGIGAARLTYGGQSNTIDLVFQPRLTPSRVPLLNERWAVLPPGITVGELPPQFPGGPQEGARFNHIGKSAEFSFSFYNGFDNLPLYRGELSYSGVAVQRFYPQMRMYGFDAAIPMSLLTLKLESGYFTSTTPQSDEYGIFVAQLERQTGEWSLTAGYAGQYVTRYGSSITFSPLRGATRAAVARAAYTIDTNRSFSVETVVRQNGRGFYVKPEYTQAFGEHWRITLGFVAIRGDADDFLGQYRRNSHGILTIRYSF